MFARIKAIAFSLEHRYTNAVQAFNTITQQDSKVLKGDSKAMKTIAFLTMVFLPATFTSVICIPLLQLEMILTLD